jgi:hypothetical protein
MTDQLDNQRKVTIHIDAQPYQIRAGETSVQRLRTLVKPPIPTDKDIWLDIDEAQDRKLEDDEKIVILAGMRFFTEVPAVKIKIDRDFYELYARKMTGIELRALPSPDVAPDRDLWRDIPDARDIKVQDEDVVLLHDGDKFFTAPGRINPGSHQ